MSEEIRIFGKGNCPFTQSALAFYGERAEYIDITKDKKKFKEMLGFTKGVARVPVIVEGEKVTIGYGGS